MNCILIMQEVIGFNVRPNIRKEHLPLTTGTALAFLRNTASTRISIDF